MNPSLTSVGLLTRLLDVASLRHRTISHNVANVNTPNYTRIQVTFPDEVASQLQPGATQEDTESPARADGNNVSLEQEITDLQKNTLLYTACAQFLATRLAMERSAVSGQ